MRIGAIGLHCFLYLSICLKQDVLLPSSCRGIQLHHQTPSVLMALCVPFPRCVENTIAPFFQDLKQDLEERAPFVLFDYNLYSVSDEAHHCLENFEDHSRLPWNWMFMPGETQHQPNLCTGHKWLKLSASLLCSPPQLFTMHTPIFSAKNAGKLGGTQLSPGQRCQQVNFWR